MIRPAEIKDSKYIRNLMDQLGYPFSQAVMDERVQRLLDSSSEEMLVYEEAGEVLGFISMHYSVQLGFDGDFCELSYFVVDENARGKNIGGRLEEAVAERAKERGCHLISVFSMEHRKDAHRFYIRQGYKPMERYFEKEL